MIGGSRDMKFLDGLTIISAVGAEENELASEKVGLLECELNLVREHRLMLKVAADFVVDGFEETLPLNHGTLFLDGVDGDARDFRPARPMPGRAGGGGAEISALEEVGAILIEEQLNGAGVGVEG